MLGRTVGSIATLEGVAILVMVFSSGNVPLGNGEFKILWTSF